jgi:hypothetical protein
MKQFDRPEEHTCQKVAATRFASGMLLLGSLREAMGSMAANPPAAARRALSALSETSLVSALLKRRFPDGENGEMGEAARHAAEFGSGEAGSPQGLRQHGERARCLAAMDSAQRRRLWTREDGFTLSGTRGV